MFEREFLGGGLIGPVKIEVFIAGEMTTTNTCVISNNVEANYEYSLGDWIAGKSKYTEFVNFTPDYNVKASGKSSMRIDFDKTWEEGYAP